MRLSHLLLGCALVSATGGCSIIESSLNTAASSAGNSAGQQIGNEAGNRAGNAAINAAGGPAQPVTVQGPNMGAAVAAAWTPQLMMFYTQFLFQMAFSSGGYAIGSQDYKPGQYSRFSVPRGQGDASSTLERAFLGNDAEGNQWWKVKFTDGRKGETTILEALLSPKDRKMLRLRGKFPQDAEGKEIPVTENSSYVPATRLSAKSVEGATKGIESVTVPAGTFQAKHVVFGDGAASYEWWLTDQVPGGAVKQLTQRQGGGERGSFTLELTGYGSDAQSELGTQLK